MDRIEIDSRIQDIYANPVWDTASPEQIAERERVISDFEIANDAEIAGQFEKTAEKDRAAFRDRLVALRSTAPPTETAEEEPEEVVLFPDLEPSVPLEDLSSASTAEGDEPTPVADKPITETAPPKYGFEEPKDFVTTDGQRQRIKEVRDSVPFTFSGATSYGGAKQAEKALTEVKKGAITHKVGNRGPLSDHELQIARDAYQDPELTRKEFEDSWLQRDGKYWKVRDGLRADKKHLKRWERTADVEGAYAQSMDEITAELNKVTWDNPEWKKKYDERMHALRANTPMFGAADPLGMTAEFGIGGGALSPVQAAYVPFLEYDEDGNLVSKDNSFYRHHLNAATKRAQTQVAMGIRPNAKQTFTDELRDPEAVVKRLMPVMGAVMQGSEMLYANSLAKQDYEDQMAGRESTLTRTQQTELRSFMAQLEKETLGARTSVKTLDIIIDMAPYMIVHGLAKRAVKGGLGKLGENRQVRKLMAGKLYRNLAEKPAFRLARGRAVKAVGTDVAVALTATTLDPGTTLRTAAQMARNSENIRIEMDEDFQQVYEYLGDPADAVGEHWEEASLMTFFEHFGEAGGERVTGSIKYLGGMRAARIAHIAKKANIPEGKAVEVATFGQKFLKKHPKYKAIVEATKKVQQGTQASRDTLKQFGYNGPMLEVYEEMETAMYQNVFGLDAKEAKDQGIDLTRIFDPSSWDPTDGGDAEDWGSLWMAVAAPGAKNIVQTGQSLTIEVRKGIDYVKRQEDAEKHGLGQATADQITGKAEETAKDIQTALAPKEGDTEEEIKAEEAIVESPQVTRSETILEQRKAREAEVRNTIAEAEQSYLEETDEEKKKKIGSRLEALNRQLARQIKSVERQMDLVKRNQKQAVKAAQVEEGQKEADAETAEALEQEEAEAIEEGTRADLAEAQQELDDYKANNEKPHPMKLQHLEGKVARLERKLDPELAKEEKAAKIAEEGKEAEDELQSTLLESHRLEQEYEKEVKKADKQALKKGEPKPTVKPSDELKAMRERRAELTEKVEQARLDAPTPLTKEQEGHAKTLADIKEARQMVADLEAGPEADEEDPDFYSPENRAAWEAELKHLEAKSTREKQSLRPKVKAANAAAKKAKAYFEAKLAAQPGRLGVLYRRKQLEDRAKTKQARVDSLTRIAQTEKDRTYRFEVELAEMERKYEAAKKADPKAEASPELKKRRALVERRAAFTRAAARRLKRVVRESEAADRVRDETMDRLNESFQNYVPEQLAKFGRYRRRLLGKSPAKRLRRLLSGVTEARVEQSFALLNEGLGRFATQDQFNSAVQAIFDMIMVSPRGKGQNRVLNMTHQLLNARMFSGRFSGGSVADLAQMLHAAKGTDVIGFRYKQLAQDANTAFGGKGTLAEREARTKKVIATRLTDAFGTYRVADEASLAKLEGAANQIKIWRDRTAKDPGGEWDQPRMVTGRGTFDAEDREALKTGVITAFEASDSVDAELLETILNQPLVVIDPTVDRTNLRAILESALEGLIEPARIIRIEEQILNVLNSVPNAEVYITPSMLVSNASEWALSKGYGDKAASSVGIRGLNYKAPDGTNRIFITLDGDQIDMLEETVETLLRDRGMSGDVLGHWADVFFGKVLPVMRLLIDKDRTRLKKRKTDEVEMVGNPTSTLTYNELDQMVERFITSDPQHRQARLMEFLSKNIAMRVSKDFQEGKEGADQYRTIRENEEYHFLMEFFANNTEGKADFREFMARIVSTYLPSQVWPALGLTAKTNALDNLLYPTTVKARNQAAFNEAALQVSEETRSAVNKGEVTPDMLSDITYDAGVGPALYANILDAEKAAAEALKLREARERIEREAQRVAREGIPRDRKDTKAPKGEALRKQTDRKFTDVFRDGFLPTPIGEKDVTPSQVFSIEVMDRIINSTYAEWMDPKGVFKEISSPNVLDMLERLVPDATKGGKSVRSQATAEYLGLEWKGSGSTLVEKYDRVNALKILFKRYKEQGDTRSAGETVPTREAVAAQAGIFVPEEGADVSEEERQAAADLANMDLGDLNLSADTGDMNLSEATRAGRVVAGRFYETLRAKGDAHDSTEISFRIGMLQRTFVEAKFPARVDQLQFWDAFYQARGAEFPGTVPTFEGTDRVETTAEQVAASIIATDMDAKREGSKFAEGAQERVIGTEDGTKPDEDSTVVDALEYIIDRDQTLADSGQRAVEIRAKILSTFSFLRSLAQREISDVMKTSPGIRRAITSEDAYQEYIQSSPANAAEADLLSHIKSTPGFEFKDLINIYAIYRELVSGRVSAIYYHKDAAGVGQYSAAIAYKPKMEMQLAATAKAKLFTELKTADAAQRFAELTVKVTDEMLTMDETAMHTMYAYYSALFGVRPQMLNQIDKEASRIQVEEFGVNNALLVTGKPGETLLAKMLTSGGPTGYGLKGTSRGFLAELAVLTNKYDLLSVKAPTAAAKREVEGQRKGHTDILIRKFRRDFTDRGMLVDFENKISGMTYLEMLTKGIPNSEIPLAYTQGNGSQKNNLVYMNAFFRRMDAAREAYLAEHAAEGATDEFGSVIAPTKLWTSFELDSIGETKDGKEVPSFRLDKVAMPADMSTEDLTNVLYDQWVRGVGTYAHWVGGFGDKKSLRMVYLTKIADAKKAEKDYRDVYSTLTEGEKNLFPATADEILHRAGLEGITGVELAFVLNDAANSIRFQRELWGSDVLARLKNPTDLIKRMGLALSSGPTIIPELFGKNHLNAVTINDPQMLTLDHELEMLNIPKHQQGEIQKFFRDHAEDMTDGFALIPEEAMARIQKGLGESITKTEGGRQLKLVKAVHAGVTGLNKFGAGLFTKEYAESIDGSALKFLWEALQKHNKNADEAIDIIFFGSTDKAKGRKEQFESGELAPKGVELYKPVYDQPGKQFESAFELTDDYQFGTTHHIALEDFYWLLPADHVPEPTEENIPLQLLPVLAEFGAPMYDLIALQMARLDSLAESLGKDEELTDRKIRKFLREDAHPWMELIKRGAFPLHTRFTEATAIYNEAKFLEKEMRIKAMSIQAVEHPVAAPRGAMPDFQIMVPGKKGGLYVPSTNSGGKNARVRSPRINVNVGSGGRVSVVMKAGNVVNYGKAHKQIEDDAKSVREAFEFVMDHLPVFMDMFELDPSHANDIKSLNTLMGKRSEMEAAIKDGTARFRVEELESVGGFIKLPGSPVLIQRVPSDNNYSATMTRINDAIPGGANVVITPFDRQIKAGPDFDIDKRFAMTMALGKGKQGISFSDEWGLYNRFMLNLLTVYNDPLQFDRVNNALEHGQFKKAVEAGKAAQLEADKTLLRGIPNTPSGRVAAYQANVLGQKGLGRIATAMYGANLMAAAKVGVSTPLDFKYNGKDVFLNAITNDADRNFFAVKDALGLVLNKYTDHANLQEIDKIGGDENTASLMALMLYMNTNLKDEYDVQKYLETIKEVLLSPEVQVWSELERDRTKMGEKYIFKTEARKTKWKAILEEQGVENPNEAIWDVLIKLSSEMFDITSALRGHIKLATSPRQFKNRRDKFQQVIRNTYNLKRPSNAPRMLVIPRVGTESIHAPATELTTQKLFEPARMAYTMLESNLFSGLPYDSGVADRSNLFKRAMTDTFQDDTTGDDFSTTKSSEQDVNRYQEAIDTIITVHGMLRGNFVAFEDLTKRLQENLDALQVDATFSDNQFLRSIGWREYNRSTDSASSIEVLMKGAQLSLPAEYELQYAFRRLPEQTQFDLLLYAVMRYGSSNFLTKTGSYLRWVDPAYVRGLLPNIQMAERDFLRPPDGSKLVRGRIDSAMVTFIRKYANYKSRNAVYSPEDEGGEFSEVSGTFDRKGSEAVVRVMTDLRIQDEALKAEHLEKSYEALGITEQERQLAAAAKDPMAQIPPEFYKSAWQESEAIANQTDHMQMSALRGEPMSAAHAMVNAAYRFAEGDPTVPLTGEQKAMISEITTRYAGLVDILSQDVVTEEDGATRIKAQISEKAIREAMLKFNEYRRKASSIKRNIKAMDNADKTVQERTEAIHQMLLAEYLETPTSELENLQREINEGHGLYTPDELRFSLHTLDDLTGSLEEADTLPNAFQNRLINTTRGIKADTIRYQSLVVHWRKSVGATPANLTAKGDPRPGDELMEAFTVLLESDQTTWNLEYLEKNKELFFVFDEAAPIRDDKGDVIGYRAVPSTVRYVSDIINNYEKARAKDSKLAPWLEVIADMKIAWEDARLNENARVGVRDWIPSRQKYVPHQFKKDSSRLGFFDVEASEGSKEGGVKKRASGEATYLTSMQQRGAIPKTWDASALFSHWTRSSTEAAKKRIMLQFTANSQDSSGVSAMVMDMNDPEQSPDRYELLDSRTAWRMLRSLHKQLEHLRRNDSTQQYAYQKPYVLSAGRNPWAQLSELINLAGDKSLKALGYKKLKYHSMTNQVRAMWIQQGAAFKTVDHAVSRGLKDRVDETKFWSGMGLVWRAASAVKAFNQMVKTINVGFSAFHHLALMESYAADLGVFKSLIHSPWLSPIHFAVQLVRGVREYRQLVRDPEETAKWAGAGLEVNVLPEEMRARSLEKGVLNAGLWLKGKRGLKKAGQFLIWNTNIKARLDHFLWTGMVPVMKIRMADNFYAQLRKDPRLTSLSDESLRSDVSKYVNDALGGQEWEQHMWATPMIRDVMNGFLFAPDWTISALRISGMPQLVGKALGAEMPGNVTDDGASFFGSPVMKRRLTRYWPGFIFNVLFWAPTMAQYMVYAMFGGGDDEDDRMNTWMNEGGLFGGYKGSIDITPMIRTWYASIGMPPPDRRVYMSFGKQAREIWHWMQKPDSSLFGKSSVSVRMTAMGFLGVKTWDSNPSKRWTVRDDERFKEIFAMMLPFSMTNKDVPRAAAIFAPTKKGSSVFGLSHELAEAYQRKRRVLSGGRKETWEQMVQRIDETEARIYADADRNDLSAKAVQSEARSLARLELNNYIWNAMARENPRVNTDEFRDKVAQLYLLDQSSKRVRAALRSSIDNRMGDRSGYSAAEKMWAEEVWQSAELRQQLKLAEVEANQRYGRYGRRKSQKD